MKISLNWIQEYIDLSDKTFEEIVYQITKSGLEVENIEKKNNDTILDIEVTPNRPDWLSYWD